MDRLNFHPHLLLLDRYHTHDNSILKEQQFDSIEKNNLDLLQNIRTNCLYDASILEDYQVIQHIRIKRKSLLLT